MGRRKKIVDEEPEEVEASEEASYPPKEFHWSDDGPQYSVMVEFDDGYEGYRHYGTFFETNSLAEAKRECLAMFESRNKTTLIHDRAEHNREIVRHEAEKITDDTPANIPPPKKAKVVKEVKEDKDGDQPIHTEEPAKKRRGRPPKSS